MNKYILKQIMEIKEEHPFWGYRRVWAFLRFIKGLPINPKRVYRLMQMNNLLCERNLRLRAKRTKMRSKPRPKRPNSIWGIDMTKVKISGAGWAYLHVVLDWYSKKIVGWCVASTSRTSDWADALEMAVNGQFPRGIRQYPELKLVSDNGCQPTSGAFAERCKLLGINQIFTSYSNPKGNADTERVIRTIKEDLVYINEFESVSQFRSAFAVWVCRYNEEFPHSALKYKTPYQAERDFVNLNTNVICA